MQKQKEKSLQIDSICIGLASPNQIRSWAERKLDNGRVVGQVTNPQTVNYKTLRPEFGGLFCEKIFGPIKDFECACGKTKTIANQKYCPECEVDYVSSRVRRYRLGYIKLASPVAHIWFLKGTPSYLSIILDMPRKKVESIIYCTEHLSFHENPSSVLPWSQEIQSTLPGISNKQSGSEKKVKDLSLMGLSRRFIWESQEEEGLFQYYSTANFSSTDKPIPTSKNGKTEGWMEEIKVPKKFKNQNVVLGANSILHLLKTIDFPNLERQINSEIWEIQEEMEELESYIDLYSFQERRLRNLVLRRSRMLKRFKYLRQFRRRKMQPDWMILSYVPVLPPDLRPIVQLDNDQVAVSDLNKLYQKVIFRNNRMKRHQHSRNIMNQSEELKYTQRLLQEAVDCLIENGKGGIEPMKASNDRPFKSLSDMLKGKKGRFRQNLLGKRVDYSGRSVIVVGPYLKLHECGIPREMAIELFQPFLIRTLIATNVVRTILGAKHLIAKQDQKIWKCLEQVLNDHPVLLNRAPTLHRLGIQAFQPKLIYGRAIHLHPLVCPAFNADFDGDQMAVHVPLSNEARAEAWNLMWSRNNLLSPATGQPILLPSQDMVLGCFYLTTFISEKSFRQRKTNLFFANSQEVLSRYLTRIDHPQKVIWLRQNLRVESDDLNSKPLEIHITKTGKSISFYPDRFEIYLSNFQFLVSYIRTTIGRVFLNSLFKTNI